MSQARALQLYSPAIKNIIMSHRFSLDAAGPEDAANSSKSEPLPEIQKPEPVQTQPQTGRFNSYSLSLDSADRGEEDEKPQEEPAAQENKYVEDKSEPTAQEQSQDSDKADTQQTISTVIETESTESREDGSAANIASPPIEELQKIQEENDALRQENAECKRVLEELEMQVGALQKTQEELKQTGEDAAKADKLMKKQQTVLQTVHSILLSTGLIDESDEAHRKSEIIDTVADDCFNIIQSATEHISNAFHAKNELKLELDDYKAKHDDQLKMIEVLNDEVQRLNNSCAEKDITINSISSELEQARKMCEEKGQSTQNNEDIVAQLQETQKALSRLQEENVTLQTSLKAANNEMAGKNSDLFSLQMEKEKLTERVTYLESQTGIVGDLQERLIERANEIGTLRAENERLKINLSETTSNLANMKKLNEKLIQDNEVNKVINTNGISDGIKHLSSIHRKAYIEEKYEHAGAPIDRLIQPATFTPTQTETMAQRVSSPTKQKFSLSEYSKNYMKNCISPYLKYTL